MNKARRFVIETPLGKLEVYAKHDKSDCAEDYPGVFIDFVREDGATVVLACVEYDPDKDLLQTVVMAIAHRTSQQRLLNTTTLILKNEEDRLCLIGRLELLR